MIAYCIIEMFNKVHGVIDITQTCYFLFSLKSQRQIWHILQGVSSLGVQFTRNILAWYDK